MDGRYLLDANVIIDLFKKKVEVVKKVRQAVEIYLPVNAVGELFYGGYKSERQVHIDEVEELLGKIPTLNCDRDTARIYGQTKNQLRLKGRPIPENDIWIAALAIQYDLTVVTNDHHFGFVDGLKTESW